MPRRPAWFGCLGAGTAVVSGPAENFPHDLGRTNDRLVGEFGLDGPAFTGPGQGRAGWPVQFAVRKVIAQAGSTETPRTAAS